MQVTINGEPTSLTDINTVDALIAQLDLDGRLAVEINQQIVPRSQFNSYRINEGDIIEIVHAIGGG